MYLKSLVAGTLLAASLATPALARDEIRIVGSSTVYPFTTVVAERFGRTTNHPTPVVESTGTGGGMKLFCAGASEDTPDISNASRAVKSTELDLCAANGVQHVIEVKIGYDGIVLANSKAGTHIDLSTREIFLALAQRVPDANGALIENPYRTWKQINQSLPATPIEVFGPPPTSGTRDAFMELAMESGCDSFASIKALKKSDKNGHKTICHSMREDGVFVEAGENDNLIVQKLVSNPNALGIFGFSFLDQNSDKVQAAKINGVAASFDAIADGEYPIARPLFFYVKGEHLDTTPGLRDFVLSFISDQASGEDGYLADRGLIPLAGVERREWVEKVSTFQSMR